MFEKLKVLAARLDELEMRLSAPDLYDDPDRAAKLLRERNELEPIVTAFREYEQAQRTLADATEMLSDPDMKELAQEELQQAKSDIARLEDELKILLLPKDPNDEKNIYVEIRGGAGGEESALFAADLYRMYTMYADKRGWQTEVMNKSETELGGYKESCSAWQAIRCIRGSSSRAAYTACSVCPRPKVRAAFTPRQPLWLSFPKRRNSTSTSTRRIYASTRSAHPVRAVSTSIRPHRLSVSPIFRQIRS